MVRIVITILEYTTLYRGAFVSTGLVPNPLGERICTCLSQTWWNDVFFWAAGHGRVGVGKGSEAGLWRTKKACGLERVAPKAGDRSPLCSKWDSQRAFWTSSRVETALFWKLEEPDSSSSSAITCLVILGASSPPLDSSFLIKWSSWTRWPFRHLPCELSMMKWEPCVW